MPSAEPGNTIRLRCRGTLPDGRSFCEPGGTTIEYTVAAGQVIEGLDIAVLGMHPGERREVLIPSFQAYGERNPDLLMELDRGALGGGDEVTIGQRVRARTPIGELPVTIVADNGARLTVDANHPLAGYDLLFELELLEVAEAIAA